MFICQFYQGMQLSRLPVCYPEQSHPSKIGSIPKKKDTEPSVQIISLRIDSYEEDENCRSATL